MNFKKTTLDNGLRIITVPQNDSLSATVLVLVAAGSKYETKDINGLSHFLEHMCFKGTKNRPHTIDIAGELDSIGALYNAFTGQEYTGYYAKSEARHIDKILDIVSDLYLNPVFDQEEINKERGVVIEEINMYEDLHMRRVQEIFTQLLYGDQPAGWDIGGDKEVIKRLNREEFIKYRGEHYLANSTVVVVAGKFDENNTIEKIKSFFSGIHSGIKSDKIKTIEHQEIPGISIKHKDIDQTHMVLGVRTFDLFDKRRYALEVLSSVLGGGMSSRLWQKVREEMGAAYYVHANADFYTDHGFLAVSSGVDNTKLKEVIKAVLHEFSSIKNDGVNDAELKRAKDNLTGGLVIGLETSDSLANFYGLGEILKEDIMSPDELSKNIQAVTAQEVKEVASEIFKNERLNLAIIGPLSDNETLRPILKID